MKNPVFCITILLTLFVSVVGLAVTQGEDASAAGEKAECVSDSLIEDNGETNASVSYDNAYFVTCIQPPAYPSFLTEITGYSTNSPEQPQQSHYAVFVSSADDGPPDSLTPYWTSVDMAIPNMQWHSLDLTGEAEFDVPITSGSWCFGILTPNINLAPSRDTDRTQGGGFFYTDNGAWYQDHYNGDLLYRGVSESCDNCACYIDGACYYEGDWNPADTTEVCDPAASVGEWTETDCSHDLLSEDNGDYSHGVSMNDTYFVTCIQPSVYPSFLSEVAGYSGNYLDKESHYAVFVSSAADGPPDSTTPYWTSGDMVLPDQEWHSLDLTGDAEFDTPITSGSWCFGILTPAGTSITASLDDNGTQGGGFWYNPAGTWALDPSNGDLMYRGTSLDCPDCACYIDDTCYYEGDINPSNECEQCDPSSSVDSWSGNDGVTCDDGVGCTEDDICTGNVCGGTPLDSLCDDGKWCTGAETCDPVNDCQAGTAPDCDDSVSCTVDACSEVEQACLNVANDGLCNDLQWCNGTETCDAINGCQAGTPPDCDDGLFCTGTESCDEENDQCVSSGDPCDAGLVCIEDGDTCDVETAIELVSFTASEVSGVVFLQWETATEAGNAGFRLWRAGDPDDDYRQITASLIPSEGDAFSGAM